MITAIRTPATASEMAVLQLREASPLDAIHMSAYERRQAEHDMRTAECIVGFAFDAVASCQALARRLRGAPLVRVTH